MAKRWKRRQTIDLTSEEETTPSTNQPVKPKMIEYSIAPYKPITTSYQSYGTTRKQMSKEDYEAYLVLAAMRGFKMGAQVETNYGAKAHITGIKGCNPTIDIWGDKTIPDCFLITRDDTPNAQNNVGYNENELTIIKE